MRHNNLKGSLLLIVAALIWGLAFVAQSGLSDLVPPFAVNCLRSLISAAFLWAVLKIKGAKTHLKIIPKAGKERRIVLKAGLICGVMLAVSVNFQQFGIAFYPPEGVAIEAHAGFITALYVILVPVFSLFLGKRASLSVWIAVGVALGGFYLLCLSGGIGGLYFGDLLVFCCAVSFAVHILAVDRFVEQVGGIRLSMLQFLVCGVISGLLSLIFECSKLNLDGILSAAPQILYLGILSSGIAYTLQIIGQRYAEPAVASLSMSLESVFAALGGWFVGNVLDFGAPRNLSAAELVGCALVFAAIVLAQLPIGLQKKSVQKT